MAEKSLIFAKCFNELKSILLNYEKELRVHVNREYNFSLNAGYDEKRKADIYFGRVVINKNYVILLDARHVNPNLLNGISPELKKRMQGKSCLILNRLIINLFKELSNLTKKGFEFYKVKGML